MEYRLGAVYLRKNARQVTKSDRENFESLNTEAVNQQWIDLGPMPQLTLQAIPAEAGVFEFCENGHTLYIHQAERSLRAAVASFAGGQPFQALANIFWTPNLNEISLHILRAPENSRIIALRLIQTLKPIFNMPVHYSDKDAA